MAVGAIDQTVNVFAGSVSKLSQYMWIGGIILFLVCIGIGAYVIYKLKSSKNTWSLEVRIRQEDTINKTIPLDAVTVKARRITLQNGLKMMLLEKQVLGKRLMPLLNFYTRPGVYDIVLTADNRIFLITGIEGIDDKRKVLNVGIRYPGIDTDFDELNNEYSQLNRDETKSNILEMLKAASIGIAAVCGLVALIIGGNYYLQSLEHDARITNAEADAMEQMRMTAIINTEYANTMILLINDLEERYGTRNLRNQVDIINNRDLNPPINTNGTG